MNFFCLNCSDAYLEIQMYSLLVNCDYRWSHLWLPCLRDNSGQVSLESAYHPPSAGRTEYQLTISVKFPGS